MEATSHGIIHIQKMAWEILFSLEWIVLKWLIYPYSKNKIQKWKTDLVSHILVLVPSKLVLSSSIWYL
jgi:hypothetical protein